MTVGVGVVVVVCGCVVGVSIPRKLINLIAMQLS